MKSSTAPCANAPHRLFAICTRLFFLRVSSHSAPFPQADATGWRAVFLLYVAFMGIAAWRTVFEVALPCILKDPRLSVAPARAVNVLTAGTSAYIAGKGLACVYVDRVLARFGAKAVLLVGLLAPAACALAIGAAAYPAAGPPDAPLRGLTAAFCVGRAAEAAVWPAMAWTVQRWFAPAQSAGPWGVLSTASRVGYIASDLLLGALVQSGYSWGSLYLVTATALVLCAAGVQLHLPAPRRRLSRPGGDKRTGDTAQGPRGPDLERSAGCGAVCAPNGPEPCASMPHRPSKAAQSAGPCDPGPRPPSHRPPQSLRALLRDATFWALLGSFSALTAIAKIKSLAPLFLTEYIGLAPGAASMTASAFSAGAAASAVGGGLLWPHCSPGARLWAISGLCLALFVGCGAFAVLVWAQARGGALAGALLLGLGLAYGAPQYVPSNVFATERGRGNIGGLTAALDVGGYACELATLRLAAHFLRGVEGQGCRRGTAHAPGTALHAAHRTLEARPTNRTARTVPLVPHARRTPDGARPADRRTRAPNVPRPVPHTPRDVRLTYRTRHAPDAASHADDLRATNHTTRAPNDTFSAPQAPLYTRPAHGTAFRKAPTSQDMPSTTATAPAPQNRSSLGECDKAFLHLWLMWAGLAFAAWATATQYMTAISKADSDEQRHLEGACH